MTQHHLFTPGKVATCISWAAGTTLPSRSWAKFGATMVSKTEVTAFCKGFVTNPVFIMSTFDLRWSCRAPPTFLKLQKLFRRFPARFITILLYCLAWSAAVTYSTFFSLITRILLYSTLCHVAENCTKSLSLKHWVELTQGYFSRTWLVTNYDNYAVRLIFPRRPLLNDWIKRYTT